MPLSRLSSQGSVPQGHRIVVSVRADSDSSPTWRAEVGSDVDRGDNCRQENIFIVREGGVGRPTPGSKYSIFQASVPLAFFKMWSLNRCIRQKGKESEINKSRDQQNKQERLLSSLEDFFFWCDAKMDRKWMHSVNWQTDNWFHCVLGNLFYHLSWLNPPLNPTAS